MYRYSDKKNRHYHERLQKKSFPARQRRKITLKKPRLVTRKNTSRPRSVKNSHQRDRAKNSLQVIKFKPLRLLTFSWWKPLLKFLWGMFLVIILAGGSIILCLNSFLPLIFELTTEQTLMLIEGESGGRVNQAYLVNISPQAKQILVLQLDPQMLLPVAGQYGTYPLATVSQFLTAQGSDAEQIRKTYNLAFGHVIDKIYYFHQLPSILSKHHLKQIFNQYVTAAVKDLQPLDKLFWQTFFALRSYSYYNFAAAAQLSQVADWGRRAASKPFLSACPLVLVNAASSQGLASKVSQILEKNGLEVRHLDSAAQATVSSQIFYDEQNTECVQAVETITAILPQEMILSPDGGQEASKNRAKAVIVLGQTMAD